LHAFRRPQPLTASTATPGSPYRTTPVERAPPPVWTFALAPLGARVRLLTGSLFAIHLSLWTLGWSGGSWPAHSVALDLAVTLAVLLSARVWRVRLPYAPTAALYLHLGIQLGLITSPATTLQWGATAVVTGFVLLLASLVLAWRLRHEAPGDVPPGPC
jgi:hypothetical protein